MQILIVDDHAVMRHGCATLLRECLTGVQVDELESAEQVLQQPQGRTFDLVLVDVALPGMSGIELVRRLLLRDRRNRVLVYSMHDESAVIRQALEAGAAGYVSKRSKPAVLLEAIRCVLRGGRFVEHRLSMRLAWPGGYQGAGHIDHLTAREFEIFVLIAHGHSLAECARRLHLSSKTVANNVSLIKSKLGVSNNAELVHIALDEGLLATPHTPQRAE